MGLLRATQATKEALKAKQFVSAVVGNGLGAVEVPGEVGMIWVRLGGDISRLTKAYNPAGGITVTDGMAVDLQARGGGIAGYQVVGLSTSAGYVTDPNDGDVKLHGISHERRSDGVGGWDPVDIFPRALVPVRAVAQYTPNMTLYVQAGYYNIGADQLFFTGGDSPALTADGNSLDVVTLDRYGIIAISAGADITANIPFPVPTTSNDVLRLCGVRMAPSMTAVTEDDIEDMRPLWTVVGDIYQQVTFMSGGGIGVGTGLLKIYNNYGRTKTITKVMISVDTSPGTQALIVDVNKGGTTLFTNQAHRPQIAAGANTGSTSTIDVSSWADGEYLTFDVDQIGTSPPGADLTVHIVFR